MGVCVYNGVCFISGWDRPGIIALSIIVGVGLIGQICGVRRHGLRPFPASNFKN